LRGEWRRSGNISSTCLNLTRGDFLNYVLKLPTFSSEYHWEFYSISVFSFHIHACIHILNISHTMKIENGNYLHGLWIPPVLCNVYGVGWEWKWISFIVFSTTLKHHQHDRLTLWLHSTKCEMSILVTTELKLHTSHTNQFHPYFNVDRV
jgi:hypothetical protein